MAHRSDRARVDSGDALARTPPPYGLLDSPQSLLVVSDLVFIDLVSTGYPRAVEGGKANDHHGFTADIEIVGGSSGGGPRATTAGSHQGPSPASPGSWPSAASTAGSPDARQPATPRPGTPTRRWT
ncbi:MAG: hypothetical protein ABIQ13_05655 [Pedococcus sp.]